MTYDVQTAFVGVFNIEGEESLEKNKNFNEDTINSIIIREQDVLKLLLLMFVRHQDQTICFLGF